MPAATHVHSRARRFSTTKTVPLATYGAAGRFAILFVTSQGQSAELLNSYTGWTLFLDLGAGDTGNNNRPRMWGLYQSLTGSMSDHVLDTNAPAGGWVLSVYEGTPNFGSLVAVSEFGFGTSMELAAPGTGDGVRVGVCSPNVNYTVTTPATSIDSDGAEYAGAWGSYEINGSFTSGTTPSFTTTSGTDYTLGWVFVPVTATGQNITATPISSTVTVGSPSVNVNPVGATIQPAELSSTVTVGSPTVGGAVMTVGAGGDGSGIRVDVLDAGHTQIGEVTDYDQLSYTRSAVTGGRFVLSVPVTQAARLLRDTPGAEIRVTDGGVEVFAGPVLNWEQVDEFGQQSIRFTGINWLGMLDWRWTDPQPATTAPPFSTDAYDTYTGNVSTIIAGMVDDRCGAAAQAARQFLTVNTPSATGPTVTAKLRFRETLAETVADLATVHNHTVAVTLGGSGLEFDVWQALTRTNAPIGPDVGEVEGWVAGATAPASTHIIAGGQGELTARTFSSRSKAASARWPWRIETYVEHTEIDNQTDLDTAADGHLEELAEQATFTADVAAYETSTIRFGRDFFLGDLVPLRIAGTETNVRVMRVDTTVTDTVERRLTIGIPAAAGIARAITQAQQADRLARRQRGA